MTHMNLHCEPMLSVQRQNHKHSIELAQPQLNQSAALQAIEAFSIGFIQLDFNWKIMYWNLAAERLTGYSQEQILNKNLFDVITEMNHIEFYRKWQDILKSRKTVQFRDYFWPTQKWFEFYLYSAGEDIIVHFQDITKKFATRKTLSKKINQLKEVSMFNSHAIRKPLANLIGLTNLLDEDIKLDDFKEYVSYINKSAKNLDEIISKLNTIVSDSTDHPRVHQLEHFHFENLLNEIKQEIVKESHGQRLAIQCSDVLFYGNKEGIKFCIKELALKAIKHSIATNEVKINITVKNGHLYIKINSFGKAIAKEVLANIHASLINGKPTNNHKKLSKISQLCTQHNGSFWMENHRNEGTNYFMLFPLSNFSTFKPIHKKGIPHNIKNEINIHFDTDHQCLLVKWVGYFDSSNQKKNFYQIYEAMKTHQCSKVISDETQAVGSGINCIKWLVKYGFPLLYKTHLSHFVRIISQNEFAKLNALAVNKHLNTSFTIKIFTTHKSALEWIAKNAK
ncbi:PAS domain-containing protein [Pedobacter sp. ASV28]|uniref:PAS domain-containing protein n=1 Tax=Pedobacter sp. ASV28 TaxID=2795123 RepID=UPI001E334EA6|nr:PAS domain-containing protein [Pedobacter sp. ASV28]